MTEQQIETATVAGGCFWCMVAPFDTLDGVIKTTSGYMGGTLENPSYEDICTGTTGHAEVVQILFDPQKVSYEKILEIFWQQIDPTTLNRQFADRGTQYRTAIFYHNEAQHQIAERSKQALQDSGRFDAPIVTEITAASEFYPAEEYHQAFYQKSPERYQRYHHGSGRATYIKQVWGKNEKD